MPQSREYGFWSKVAVFLAAVIAWSHDAVGLTITNFLATPLMEEFNVGKDAIGFVFSAQYIVTILGAALFGELADRIGRRIALFLSVVWDAVLTAVTALAPNFAVLAALRILSGLGVSWGIGYALLAEVFSPKRRGFYGGLLHTTFIIGYIISAATVKTVFPSYGWRLCYLVALYPIPLILLLSRFLPESRIWQEYKRLEELEASKTGKGRVAELFTRRFLKITVVASITFWSAEFAYHAMVDWAPTMLNELFAYPVEQASSTVMLISLVALPFLPFVGFISDYIGRRKAFTFSALIGLLGTLGLWYFTVYMFDESMAIASLYVIPLGFGSHALFGVWLAEMYPTRIRATATSFIFSLARGLSIGGFLVGVLSSRVGLAAAMTVPAMAGFALMAILAWVLPETRGKVIRVEEEIMEVRRGHV